METKLEATMREDKKKRIQSWLKSHRNGSVFVFATRKSTQPPEKSLRMAVTEELTYDPIALL